MANGHVKRFLATLFAALLLITALPAQGFALGGEETESALRVYSLTRAEGGMGVYLADENGERLPDAAYSRAFGGKRAPALDLPEQYDARDEGLITPVKDQSGAGVCWAFSTVSAMETNAIKQGLAVNGAVDYSESHLANFAANSKTTDADDRTYGDGATADAHGIFDNGGNYHMAAAALARGSGAANEADYPFDVNDFYKLLPESDRYVSVMRISDSSIMDCFDGEEIDTLISDVKQAILANGSVTVSYNHNEDYYNVTTLDGVRTAAYFENAETESNHMVTIVGWDDGYSPTHFKADRRPAESGAWLCKNSWGADNPLTVDGYFYISYYEPSLQEYNAVTVQPTDAFDRIYQYDGVGYKYCWTYTDQYSENGKPKVANVFTADGDTFITSLGFWTVTGGTRCVLYVYTGLTDEGDPTSGELAAKIVAAPPYAGYHTAALEAPVKLTAGERFSVCAYMNNGTMGVFLTEGPESLGYGSRAGESFYFSGRAWFDAKTYATGQTAENGDAIYMQNAPLKVMTSDEIVHEHEAAEAVYENETAGTCSAHGSRDEVVYCAVCGAELSRETVETALDPDNHANTSSVSETASTCIAHGYSAGVYCNDCGRYISGHAEKPFADHVWDDGAVVPAVCSAGGSILYTCTVEGCGETMTVTTDPDPANHTGGTRTAAENEVAGTCSVKGSYDNVTYCLGCGAELSRETVETALDSDNHVNTSEIEETASTCIRHGYTAGVYCGDCGQYLSGHTEKPLAEHTWSRGAVTVKPTCVSEGEMTFRCTVKSCGAVKTESIPVDPYAHANTRVEGAVDATCKDEGYTGDTYCADCGALVSRGSVIAKNGSHAGGTEVRGAKAPTCGKAGYTGDTYCLGCGAKLATGKTIAKTNDHHFTVKDVVEPGCETEGYTVWICTECKTEKKDGYVPAAGHLDPDGDGECDVCGADLKPGSPDEPQGEVCKYCGKAHTGFFGKIIQLFHSILYFFKNIGK